MIEYDKTLELPRDYKFHWIAARKTQEDEFELTVVDNVGNPVTIELNRKEAQEVIELLKDMIELIK